MKKLLSLSLAALMALSIAIPAFAADAKADAKQLHIANDSTIYKSVDGTLEATTQDTFKPGSTIYIEIQHDGDKITSKLAKSYRVFTDWSVGKDVVVGTAIEYKRAILVSGTGSFSYKGKAEDLATLNTELFAGDAGKYLKSDVTYTRADLEKVIADESLTEAQAGKIWAAFPEITTSKTDYIYVVAITTKASFTTKSQDLEGTIRIGKNKSDAEDRDAYDFAFVIAYGVMQDPNGEVDSKNAPVVNFKNADDEVEMNFSDTATFTVNATNQDNKIYMGWHEKPIADIVNRNPAANVDFLTFEAAPSFNRLGELKIFSEDARYLYQVLSDGTLKQINATYDDSEECFVITTRTLGVYAFSDIELTSAEAPSQPAEPSEPVEPSQPAEGGSTNPKPVPPTGAAA